MKKTAALAIGKDMHLVEPLLQPIVSLPTRDGFGKALVELAEKNSDVWALTADVSESSRTHWFGAKFPNRFVQVGVAEQNMAGVAAGIAACGKTVFLSAYGVFSPGRNFDQIRVSICYNDVKVICHASHTGLTVGPDGASHQALEDIAMVRTLPNMIVVAPADFEQTKKAVHALAAVPGPGYLRTSREKMPVFTTPQTPFEIGKINVYREGTDVTIVACGTSVYESLRAAEQLHAEGIDCTVIDCHTIKPIDREGLVEWTKRTGLVITVEEHQVNGGMGSAVCEVLAEAGLQVRVRRHGVYDRFCESGEGKELLKKYKLDANGIADVVRETVKLKK